MKPGYDFDFNNGFTYHVTHRLHRQHDVWENIYRDARSPAALSSLRTRYLSGWYRCLRAHRPIRNHWERLLCAVGYDAPLLSVCPAVPRRQLSSGNTFLDGLFWCAMRYKVWLRPIEEWTPQGEEPLERFGSLVKHLFLHYPVPRFLLAGWFEGFSSGAWHHQNWCLHIGRGGSVQTLNMPHSLTHRAAHLFLQTPLALPLCYAPRYAQALAMGSTPEFAERLAAAFPVCYQDEQVMQRLMRLFIRDGEATVEQMKLMAGFAEFEQLRAQGMDEAFSLSGRTVRALLRAAEEWESKRQTGQWGERWKPREWANLAHDVTLDDGTTAHWTLHELTSGSDLYDEGRMMRNCVYGYAERCLRGTASIWSVRCFRPTMKKPRSVLTVELAPDRNEIVQVRPFANGNLCPTENARHALAVSLLKQWAAEQNLALACEL